MTMAHADDRCPDLEVIRGATEDIGNVFADAVRLVPATDTVERAYIDCLLGRVREGELGLYALTAHSRTVGAMCYRVLDGDAELAFGHVLAGAAGAGGYFLEAVVRGLQGEGVHTVRSNFNWPEPGKFISGALAMGFTVTERMSMCLNPRPTAPSYRGFELLPWQDCHAVDVCSMICETQAPEDRAVYPMFGLPEGARALMESVVHYRHGTFVRELSYVARADGRLIGFLLSTRLPDGSLLILDVGVDRSYRRRGVGSALLDRLIDDSFAHGYGQIVLAVTKGNDDAIRLYERKGFKVNGYFRQHVLSKIR